METILLAEDEVKLARVTLRELEANGYRVLWAGDGMTALRRSRDRWTSRDATCCKAEPTVQALPRQPGQGRAYHCR